MTSKHTHTDLPYSRTGYWVREEGETEWEDASDYVKYQYGEYYNEEEVAVAYMNYINEYNSEVQDMTIEVLNSDDKIYTYNAYVEYQPKYYADKESVRDYDEDEE